MKCLTGKTVHMVGTHPGIAAALVAAGATLTDAVASDLLVHIAAPPHAKLAHELSHAEWRASLDAGLDQRFFRAKDYVAHCRAAKRGGAILFVGAPEQALGADQAAAAGALGNLTKTLGVEWARDGIRVNSILTQDEGETVGHLAAYLLSDYAAYVTGAVTGVGLDD